MALVLADRVKETSNTTGTGTFVLAGASTGFQSFAVIGDGNTTYYTIQNPGTNEWEVGIGTYYSGNTSIVRTTVFSSSNANAVVDFSSGVKDVFVTYPAENAVTTAITNTFTNNQVISVNSATDALRITQTGAGNALVVEDSANPDSTPFVVDASGNVGVGLTTPTTQLQVYNATSSSLRVEGDSTTNITMTRYSSDTTQSNFNLRKARGTYASPSAVNSGDTNGIINFQAFGGTNYRITSQISGFTDVYTSDSTISGYLTFSTNSGSGIAERMRITSAGNVGIGGTPIAGQSFAVSKNITGATDSMGVRSIGTVQSDVTTSARAFDASFATQATSFTLPTAIHYYANGITVGSGSTVTNQYGFLAATALTGATNNYGFYSDIASGTGRWNFYANGTAKNVFAGQTSIGGLEGAEGLRVVPVASSVNYLQASGNTTGNGPSLTAQGSDTNITLGLLSKGIAVVSLDCSNTAATAFGVELGAGTTVNRDTYIDWHSSTGTDYDFRIIRSAGANNSVAYTNLGTGPQVFLTNNTAEQFRITHTASAVNYLQATGSATGNAVALSSQGSDANVSISITPKGSGDVTVNGNLNANLTTTTSGPFDSGTGATWTKPSRIATWAQIELWGGGGGGGGAASGGAGGGGGGGGYFSVTVPFSYLNTTETYTVGGGGANVSTNTNGGAGGNTTFTVTNWPGGARTLTAYGGGGGGGAASTGGYAGGGGGGSLGAGGSAAVSTIGQGGQPISGTQASGDGNEGYGGGAGSGTQATVGGFSYYGGGGGGAGENGTGTGVTGLGGNSIYGGGGGGGGNDTGTVRCPGGTSLYGGKGGDGGYGNNTTPAQNGTVPGGGGGGSDLGTAGSGNGASGRVQITIW